MQKRKKTAPKPESSRLASSLTPAYATQVLGEFQKNFSDAIETTQRFTAQYPELVNPPAAGVADSAA
jgi:hypothetical protein